ncbi:hypothetical protein CRE_14963 [Caenorhabditis remanei]|uniref:Uncharacterized protein n=1 Tax=Caenorhabditis remanei TaxID=31234 RepID=E3NBY3_CAERE|nr:hypothetical protein CRE_14963 [Caenorhabditis remanei]
MKKGVIKMSGFQLVEIKTFPKKQRDSLLNGRQTTIFLFSLNSYYIVAVSETSGCEVASNVEGILQLASDLRDNIHFEQNVFG